ncbi:methyltransferase [Mucilaginibacter sp. PAMB04274]|uniref:methyltransferase family protein n=1 Tax=Mucilaginibacter sp. PAMB04274 TaxID=3138568 RepID=UPI0031F6B67A
MGKSKSKDRFYVGVQFVLLCIYFINFWPLRFNFPYFLRFVGLVLILAGVAECLLAIYLLRKHLTPYPTPSPGATLIVESIYKYVRHPIYGGIIASTAGYAFFSQSIGRLLLVLALTILFYFKSVYEEHMLRLQFQTYEAYKKKTFSFFPFFKRST